MEALFSLRITKSLFYLSELVSSGIKYLIFLFKNVDFFLQNCINFQKMVLFFSSVAHGCYYVFGKPSQENTVPASRHK